MNWGSFQKCFFHLNSNSMENSFCSHPSCREVIATKFCLGHNSGAVVACAKFCYDMTPQNVVTLKLIFHEFELQFSDPRNGPLDALTSVDPCFGP